MWMWRTLARSRLERVPAAGAAGNGCSDAMGAAGYKLPYDWHPQGCLPLLASAPPGSATQASPHSVCPSALVTAWDREPL